MDYTALRIQFVRLTSSHFDVEVFPDQREQGRREADLALRVQRHVHADELLVGESVGTLVTKSQRRIHVFQHIIHLCIMYFTPGRWTIQFSESSISKEAKTHVAFGSYSAHIRTNSSRW